MRIEKSKSDFVGLQLSRTTAALSRALERLSSGKRIKSARDGGADLSVITRLDSQARGLSQSIRNVNQAQSLLSTAESAVSTQLDLVQRMREIAVQAASGTITSSDRQNLNTELQNLLEEYRRITSNTSFGGFNLLDGSFGTKSLQATAGKNDPITFDLNNLNTNQVFTQAAGTGNFATPSAISINASEPEDVESADFNNDGNLDFIMSSGADQTFWVMLGNGDGTFRLGSTQNGMGDDTHKIAIGDFNGDGMTDYVGESYTGLILYVGKGDGTFQIGRTLTSTIYSSELMATDLNIDGKLDVLSVNGDGTSIVLLGNGDGTFQSAKTQTLGLTGSPTGATLGDFNGDGVLDLAIAGLFNAETIKVHYGRGDGTFGSANALSNAAFYSDLIAKDINGDGRDDLVAVDSGNSRMRVYLNNGGSLTLSPTVYNLGSVPYQIQSADINRDGNVDIVVADSDSGSASILLGNGDGSFQSRKTVIFSSSSNFYNIDLADFNNDKSIDILGTDILEGAKIALGRTTTQAADTKVSVSTQAKAKELIEILDNALTNLKTSVNEIGALHNRLDFTTGAHLLLSESIEEAKSKIEDADLAETTAEMVRLQILQQAQIAVAAQANLQMQTVLGLLSPLIK